MRRLLRASFICLTHVPEELAEALIKSQLVSLEGK